MKVTAEYAQQHLAELLETADHGHEIEIAREGKSSAKLIVMPSSSQRTSSRLGPVILGAGRGELVVPTDEEWRAMKEEDARLMNDAPLMTTGEV